MTRIVDLLSMTPNDSEYSAYIDELTSLIMHGQGLTKRALYLFIAKFPDYYFVLPQSLLTQHEIARRIIQASKGRVFHNLPACIRSDPRLAALAWRLNPMMGFAIHFELRRTLATTSMVRYLMKYPIDRLTAKSLKFIPRPALRQFARNAIEARAAFYLFLHRSPLSGVLNELIASFIPIEVERASSWGKKIHWIALLKRYAV